jgi:hypothetical protein
MKICARVVQILKPACWHEALQVVLLALAGLLVMSATVMFLSHSALPAEEIQLDSRINTYRITQLEKSVEEIKQQHDRLTSLMLTTLGAIIANIGIYLFTHRRNSKTMPDR